MEKGHLSLPLACSLPRCPASTRVPFIPSALLTASCTWTQGRRGKAISQMLYSGLYGEPWEWAWRGSSCFPLTQCPEPSEGGLARQAGKSDQELPIPAAETAACAPVASRPSRSAISLHHQAGSDGNYQHFESRHSLRLAR